MHFLPLSLLVFVVRRDNPKFPPHAPRLWSIDVSLYFTLVIICNFLTLTISYKFMVEVLLLYSGLFSLILSSPICYNFFHFSVPNILPSLFSVSLVEKIVSSKEERVRGRTIFGSNKIDFTNILFKNNNFFLDKTQPKVIF